MSDPLYRKELLRLAADAHGAGRLLAPHASGTAFNPACGDRVTMDMELQDGRVTAIGHLTKACVLTQASASILCEALKGADRPAIERLRREIVSLLTLQGGAPKPPFEGYAVFDGAVAYESRHRCVLLPVDAVLAAFDALARNSSSADSAD